jgi:hypothetical protein
VTFDALGGGRTRVSVRIEYEPRNAVEKAGDALGIVQRQVRGDVERFKEFIESRGSETGAWRGEIQGGQVDQSTTQ